MIQIYIQLDRLETFDQDLKEVSNLFSSFSDSMIESNPYIDISSCDKCYRFGFTRKVKSRECIAGLMLKIDKTLEERKAENEVRS